MRAKIIKTTAEPQSKGKANWTKLNVVFRNLDTDKIDGRNLVSFNKVAYEALKDAVRDEVYELTEVKNEKGYDEIVKVTKLDSAAPGVGSGETPSAANKATGTYTAPRSNYETPEERANRQVLIVRQSSITAALKFFELTKTKFSSVQDVTSLASDFENYVMNGPAPVKPAGLLISDMLDDIPEAQ